MANIFLVSLVDQPSMGHTHRLPLFFQSSAKCPPSPIEVDRCGGDCKPAEEKYGQDPEKDALHKTSHSIEVNRLTRLRIHCQGLDAEKRDYLRSMKCFQAQVHMEEKHVADARRRFRLHQLINLPPVPPFEK